MAGLRAIHGVNDHPLPWLAPLLPFTLSLSRDETRATEYSKAATRGNWQDVWASFDQRQKAKGSAANEPEEGNGPGLFGDDAAGATQAAE